MIASTQFESFQAPYPQPLGRRIEANFRRNRDADHTTRLVQAADAFTYAQDDRRFWNPEGYALLWGTPLWEGATETQRLALDHLYWAAYYSQVISAEIATIYFNQTSAAGLYGREDFRTVCEMLDLETTQERAHIYAFKRISERVEQALVGRRLFTRPMHGPFGETMLFPDAGRIRRQWKTFQLRAFGLLSSGSAFLASQYFLVRGLRTLKGKLVQHPLSQYCARMPEGVQRAPLPAQVSHYHYLDESHHFNSSTLIGREVARCLPTPTAFERRLVDLAVRGCQRDHAEFSVVVPGIFWHDPATFDTVYRLLRSPVFQMEHREALDMMDRCFCRANEGIERSFGIHREARTAYARYVADVPWLRPTTGKMAIMEQATVPRYLHRSRRRLARWSPRPALAGAA